jgi:hypothetical protein
MDKDMWMQLLIVSRVLESASASDAILRFIAADLGAYEDREEWASPFLGPELLQEALSIAAALSTLDVLDSPIFQGSTPYSPRTPLRSPLDSSTHAQPNFASPLIDNHDHFPERFRQQSSVMTLELLQSASIRVASIARSCLLAQKRQYDTATSSRATPLRNTAGAKDPKDVLLRSLVKDADRMARTLLSDGEVMVFLHAMYRPFPFLTIHTYVGKKHRRGG